MAKKALEFETSPYRTVRFDVATDAALVNFAREHTTGNLAEALRLLVGDTLEKRGALSGFTASLETAGYAAGKAQALGEWRAALAEALNKRWGQRGK